MVGWAADLIVGNFTAANVKYGVTALPAVSNTQGLTEGTHYTVETTKFYTGEATGETLVTDGVTNNLSKAPAGVKYYIKVTGINDYDGQVIYVGFWINGVSVTIDFNADQKKDFGDDDPASYTYTLKKEGAAWDTDEGTEALGLTVDRVGGENAGNYAFTFEWTNKNYSLTQATGDEDNFKINRKTITPTVTLGSEVLTYSGEALAPTITIKVGNTVLDNDQFDIKYKKGTGSFGTAHTDAGDYTVQVTGKDDGNYDGTGTSTATFTIKQAPLSVYVNNFSKVYTAEDGVITDATFAYSGLVGADASDDTPFDGTEAAFTAAYVSGEAGTHKNVGSYNLKPVLNADAGKYDAAKYANYSVTLLTTGKLTITEKAITVKPTAGQFKTFGAADPTFTVDASEAVTADQTTVAGAYTVTRTNADVNSVGNYKGVLTLTKKTGLSDAIETILKNYTIKLEAGDFKINAATLYVYPENVTITYGDAAPALNVVATTEGGAVVTLTKTPTVKFKDLDETPTAAGTYVLTLEGDAAADGYETIVPLDGQYIIKQKSLTIKPVAQTLHVGDKEEALSLYNIDDNKVTFEGLVKGDEIGYKLEFNVGDGDGQIASTKLTSGKLNTAEPYAKGIKVTVVAATPEVPNDNDNYIIAATATAKLTVVTAATLVLDTTDPEMLDKIEAAKDQEMSVVFTNAKTLKKGQWNTLVLPFETSVTELSGLLGYAVVDMLDEDNTNANTISLKLAFGTIPANTPFLVQPVDNKEINEVNFGTKTIKYDAEPKAQDGGNHALVGTYKGLTITDSEKQYYYSPSQKKFLNANNNKIGIFGAYLLDSNGAGSRPVIYIDEADGSTTAIDTATMTTGIDNAEGWHNLSGMKLQGAPTQKGVYIKNGKKFVVK